MLGLGSMGLTSKLLQASHLGQCSKVHSSPINSPFFGSSYTMQMIKSSTRFSKPVSARAPRSLVARATEPPQAPVPTTQAEEAVKGECAIRLLCDTFPDHTSSWPIVHPTTHPQPHHFPLTFPFHYSEVKSVAETEFKVLEKSAPPSFGKVMGFSGSPEIINGRLAMLGFVAALGAELSSGDSVLRQAAEEPTGTLAVFLLVIAGSLVPAFLNTKAEAFGPLTPSAELINGRASMIGFAAMLLIEGNIHHALF